MIARLTGTPLEFDQKLIIDVNGVGYAVSITTTTFSKVDWNTLLSLWIYTHVTEQNIELFGFSEIAEQKLFKLLLSVSGVGPTTALAICNLGASKITEAVQQANVSFFTKAPRVGKKLGQKIIIELTSKLGSLKELDLQPLSSAQSEAQEALLSLGFSEVHISETLRDLPEEITTVEAMVKYVLQTQGK